MMFDAIQETRRNAMRSLIPPPKLSLPDWIESTVQLPSTVSALPGKVKLWPYQRGIADAISDPAIERVTVVKSVRIGYSMLLTSALASYVANEPAPILALLPTESDARDFMVSDLEPTFEATPELRGLLSGEADESGRSTLLSRRFPGGSLKVVAAKSPRNLRRHTARILLIDEADAMESSAEGNPLTLAERRTLSFANRKIIMGSTPIHEETSHVLRSYAASDRRVFEIPCPECGSLTELLWQHIEWEPDRPETAAFRCPHCNGLIQESHKAAMVAKGDWRITAPHVKGHAGFRINALVSNLANATWGKLATEFLKAKSDPAELQTFVNTLLGQGWREASEEIDETGLLARVEAFGLGNIPADVLVVTAGVDVQHDRLEITYLGFSRTEIFVLAHCIIWGSPSDETTWQELDDALRTTWKHPKGGTLKVDAAIVDSGDGQTVDSVYGFTKHRFNRRIVSGKGMAGNRQALTRSSAKGVPLFLVGVDGLKAQLLTRLAKGQSIRFSNSLEAEYFSQLTSERRVVRYSRGQPTKQFERIAGRRAEAVDCFCYGWAARELVKMDLDRRESELANEPLVPLGIKPGAVFKSNWLQGN
jgi:phage terminase large subunit GpA-like protein